MQTKPICPYCDFKLEKMPGRKKKCPSCKEFIFVRTHPNLRKTVLVTEEEAEEIQKEWAEIKFIDEWKSRLERFGIRKRDYEKTKKESKSPNEKDVIWGLFNQLLQENMRKGDHGELKQIYFEMALFLNAEGKDSFNALQGSAKMELMGFKEVGWKRVKILGSGNGCIECEKENGKVFQIDQALKEMPIPNVNCTHVLQEGNKPWCRCIWTIVEDSLDPSMWGKE